MFTNSETPGAQAKFAQRQVTEGDILSAVEFDPTGEFLATGDKGGQVCIFRRTPSSKSSKGDKGGGEDGEAEVVGKKRSTKT